MSSIADITQYLEPRVRLADISAAAKALLFVLESSMPATERIEKLRRLLVVFGDEAPEQALLPGEAALALLRNMHRAGFIDTAQHAQMSELGYLNMQRIVSLLHGRVPIGQLKHKGSAHLYVVVLCLARLGDGAAIH